MSDQPNGQQRFEGTKSYIATEDLKVAVNAAVTLRRPLLVKGEPGTGKTELAPGILSRGGVFVEYPPQTRIEGEIQQMPGDFPVTELWQVIAGQAPGRTDARQITLFDSVGFAVEDFSALRYIRSKLAETGLFDQLDMIADPDDPRDLFGMILRAA